MTSASKSIRLLLIDEDIDLLEYWNEILGRAFGKVRTASNGYDALNALTNCPVDVVIYNQQISDLDGVQFCREIKTDKNSKHTAIILYGSAYVSEADKALALNAGASRLISRISNVDSIIRLIREVYEENHSNLLQWDTADKVIEQNPVVTSQSRIASLELALSRYRAFADCVSEYVWETDAKGLLTFTYTGPHNPLKFPDNPVNLVGTPSEQWAEVFQDQGLERLAVLLAQQEAFRCMLPLVGESNSRVISAVAKPYARNDGEFAGFRGVFADVTDAQLASEQLQYEASHDALTGLKNSRFFDVALQNAISEEENHVLCYLDLDFFKTVNDTAGHGAGDLLLRELSELFQSKVRGSDLLARIGGDEFAILLRNCGLDQARRLVQDLHSSVSKYRFKWQGRNFEIGLSIGLVRLNQPSLGVKEVMSLADQACYAAKNSGRNKLVVYGEGADSKSKLGNEAEWLEKFHHAINHEGMCLLRQPIQRISKRDQPLSYEVLVRMRDGKQLISPDEFLPIIERYQLSPVLDEWVIKSLLEWLNHPSQLSSRYDYYSINISGISLCKEEFKVYVYALLQDYLHLTPRICFEITETAAIENLPAAINFISDMRSLGCRFSLDDFGTGFSSMAYLKTLPVDYLKIDGVFVTGVASDPVDLGMLQSIQHLAGVLNIKTIAEYVENEEIASKLRDVGIDCLQGFYIGYPEMIERVR